MYIDESHARVSNSAINAHSPGIVYNPRPVPEHVPSPAFHMSGDADRFYNRFELGRLG